MSREAKVLQPISFSHTGRMETSPEAGGWTIVRLPGASEHLGTRRAVKIAGTIDGHDFAATLLPLGDGLMMVPIKAALRKQIGKEAGADVSVHLTNRFS